jgi:hypothetical protein
VTIANSIPVLLAAVVLAGCAGDGGRLSKTEYAAQVRSVYAGVQEAFAATNVPPEELPDRVEDAQAELREAADELEGLEPPGTPKRPTRRSPQASVSMPTSSTGCGTRRSGATRPRSTTSTPASPSASP